MDMVGNIELSRRSTTRSGIWPSGACIVLWLFGCKSQRLIIIISITISSISWGQQQQHFGPNEYASPVKVPKKEEPLGGHKSKSIIINVRLHFPLLLVCLEFSYGPSPTIVHFVDVSCGVVGDYLCNNHSRGRVRQGYGSIHYLITLPHWAKTRIMINDPRGQIP